jgi:hypothetical protein
MITNDAEKATINLKEVKRRQWRGFVVFLPCGLMWVLKPAMSVSKGPRFGTGHKSDNRIICDVLPRHV